MFMLSSIIRALKLVLLMTFLTGIAYPLIMTVIAQVIMHHNAQGSLVRYKDKIIGSYLIGQTFTKDNYFWSRPSATDYNTLPSGGSNLGPTSKKLKELVKQRQEHLGKAHSQALIEEIPGDMLYASGSGLDPDITVKSAMFQLSRVAKANNIDQESLKALILKLSKTYIPFLGPLRVNVLELNIALDELRRANHGR